MIIVALGANLNSTAGAPLATLQAALVRMEARGINVLAVSRFYATPAWPDPTEPPFVNGIACVRTKLSPTILLQTLHEIEAEFGRVRSRPNAPRTLDLDLIDYNGIVVDDMPVLPHPRLAERAFVLVPLCDVAPDWCHPVTRVSVRTLLERLPDTDRHAVVALN